MSELEGSVGLEMLQVSKEVPKEFADVVSLVKEVCRLLVVEKLGYASLQHAIDEATEAIKGASLVDDGMKQHPGKCLGYASWEMAEVFEPLIKK